MSDGFSFSRFPFCYFFLLLFLALFQLCLSDTNSSPMLCMDDEKQALLRFKHGLIDDAGRLASWVQEENSDCCKWAGIRCDNITGHVLNIHLSNNCYIPDDEYIYYEKWDECSKQTLKGDISPSLLKLKQLKHLDLSNNFFGGEKIPRFMGCLRNLRYLNLSRSGFGGIVPPQLGNLSELRTLSLGSFYEGDERTSMMNMQWLSGLRYLHHLDMSGVDLSKAIDWFQVVNTLPSLVELHLSSTRLKHIHPNNFMNSPLVLKGLSSSKLISLDIAVCNVSSLVLDSLHNLTSLLSLDLSNNQLTKTIPKSLAPNLCNLREIDLSANSFGNISLTSLLESFFECKSPSLESLSIDDSGLSSHLPDQLGQLTKLIHLNLQENRIVGTIPDSVGRLSFLKYLNLDGNLISGQIPFSIKGLSSLEELSVSDNQLNGSLPDSLGLLSNLETLDISHNLLTGVVTDAHFAKLNRLKYLLGTGNNLILRLLLTKWHPLFRLEYLSISSWHIGPQFPLWLLQQSDLIYLDISNTKISSTLPLIFWRSFPNLSILDMSQNHIQGRLVGIPGTLNLLNLSYNKFSGQLPQLANSSSMIVLDLSYNSFVGMLHHLICPYGGKGLEFLNLANNHLSGAIPNQCWEKYPRLGFLYLENNNLSGRIPTNLGFLSSLYSLNMCNNKLSGRLPTSLKNLTRLSILQLAKNRFVGRIPTWVGTELSILRLLNLRSNKFNEIISRELCYLTSIQILDLAHNNLSGNIPRCFNNFTLLSGKEAIQDSFSFFFSVPGGDLDLISSASLVIKGREDIYSTILKLVMIVDLSSNNFSGGIPSELMALRSLQSLNLSRNQLTGSIPKNIGDMKPLVSFDVSLNQLSGELPASLSSLTFLSCFNVSYNSFTGRVPTSTQLQSFSESSFFSNKLCGKPLLESCAVAVPDANHEDEEKNEEHGADWGLIISTVSGFIAGFWVVLVPLVISTKWRIAYFGFLRELKYMVCDVIRKYWCNMFHK